MNRRDFLGAAAGVAVAAGTRQVAQPAAGPVTGPENQRQFIQPRTGVSPYRRTREGRSPHIIFISADMVSPDLYHPDRPLSKHVHLPALRSLMADGTFFANSFCTVPLCAPSRASYLTGRYSYIQGNGERAPEGLETELRPTDIIFPEYLRAAGYVARQFGKSHVGTAKFLDAFTENDQPWDRWSPPVFDDDAYLSYQQRLGVRPQKYSREIVFLQQDRRSPGNSVGGWIVQEDGKPFPLEAQYSYFLVKKAIETVETLLSKGSGRGHPMYLQLDIFDPHQPFSIPAGFEEREGELRAALSLPDSYRAAQQANFLRAPNEPEIVDVYRRYWGLYDPEQLLNYRVAYALQMEIVDHTIGMLLTRLKELGLYDEMLIAFISDHGEMNGRRAMVDKGVYLYPDVLRVPFIIKTPRHMPRKHAAIESPVSILDLSQTLLEFAGVRPEAKFDGVSLVPYLRDGKGSEDRTLLFFGGWHVGVNFACGIQRRSANGKRYLYAYNCTSTFDELYDLDSEDAVNLIDRPDHSDIRQDLIRQMGTALQGDPRWVGFWAEFRIARFDALPKESGEMQLLTGSS